MSMNPRLLGPGFEKPHMSQMANWSWVDVHPNFTFPSLELSFSSQVALYTVYVTTTVVSVLGNALVIFVLVEGNRSKKKLNVFLINLAVADLLMAIFCMPYTFTETMLGRWVFGSVMCPLVAFMQIVSVAVSIFTNMAIAIDRYRAVIAPFNQRTSKRRAKLAILFIWLCALAVSSPQLVTVRSIPFQYAGQQYEFCDEEWDDHPRMCYTLSLVCLTFVLPLSAISFTYYRILTILRVRSSPGNADDVRDYRRLRSKRKVIKMLIVIVFLFGVSWLPLHFFTVLQDFAPKGFFISYTDPTHELIVIGAFYCVHWLAMANSFVNPLIYSFMNDYFKADLRYLFRRKRLCWCLRRRRLSFRRSSTFAITFHKYNNTPPGRTLKTKELQVEFNEMRVTPPHGATTGQVVLARTLRASDDTKPGLISSPRRS